ncbi:MAG: GTPase HflX [Negativicutes bacterium]|jgi:GTP-binding protein HflX
MNLLGETQGIKKYLLDELKSLLDLAIPKDSPCDYDLAKRILEISLEINKEIALIINRGGIIKAIAIGDNAKVSLPDVSGRRSEQSLSGVRCIHTHPSGSALLSPQDLSSLAANRYDLMAALALHETKPVVAFAYLDSEFAPTEGGYLTLEDFCQLNMPRIAQTLDSQFQKHTYSNDEFDHERAILVAVDTSGHDTEASLDELALLTDTAGAEVVGRLVQKRAKIDSGLYIGMGKAEELHALCQNLRATTAIFDDELSPAQQRNLEEVLGIKIIDRTALILDIFAQHARSHEGKIQVELAQLRYRLTRLTGMGLVLSRLGGGIGTRGPGETKLEVDRRKIRGRISDLEKETKQFVERRELLRARRVETNITTVALIGYTNTGKSTLMNKLTQAGVLAEDKLFATLDPTTRKYLLPNNTPILVTDTVGFITKLPHGLIKAFRATLEETIHADLLLHIVDSASSESDEQCAAVIKTLQDLKIADKPILTVYNKIDKNLSPEHIARLAARPDSVVISALTGANIDKLTKKIEQFCERRAISLTLLLPYDKTAFLNRLYEIALVKSVEYIDEGVAVEIAIAPEWREFVSEYEQ